MPRFGNLVVTELDVRDTIKTPQGVIRPAGDPVGNTYYVDGSKTASGTGKSWTTAFKTITEALDVAGDNDVIKIAPGDYDEGASLTITQDGLQMIGFSHSENGYPVLILNSSGDTHHLVVVKANNVLLHGLGFVPTQSDTDAIHIGDTNGQAYYKLTIDQCKFDGFGTGEYAIRSGATAGDSSGPDAPDITIQNCLFRSFATCVIQDNWTRPLIRNNIIHVPASTIGIEIVPTTGSRPDRIIKENVILGAASSDTGIKITNSPSAGTYALIENKVLNCNTGITGKATNDAVSVLNYVGDASGGALIDPSP